MYKKRSNITMNNYDFQFRELNHVDIGSKPAVSSTTLPPPTTTTTRVGYLVEAGAVKIKNWENPKPIVPIQGFLANPSFSTPVPLQGFLATPSTRPNPFNSQAVTLIPGTIKKK